MGSLHFRHKLAQIKEKEHKCPPQCECGKITLKEEHIGWFQPSLENIIGHKHHVSVHMKEWNCSQVAAGVDQLPITMPNLPC